MNKQEKILIIGVNGFSGRNILEYVSLRNDMKAFGFDLADKSTVLPTNYFSGDLSNYEQIEDVIKNIKPDFVVNAGGSYTHQYDIDYKNNVIATKNLLDSLVNNKLMKTTVLLVGTSGEYGFSEPGQTISEQHHLKPLGFYALTKVFQDQLALMYFQRYGIDIRIARTFNMIGPGMSEKLFIGRFFRSVKEYLNKKIDAICLDNLESYRDYIDIRDVADVYFKILLKGQMGTIYNVGSGKAVKIRDIVDYTLLKLNIDTDVLVLDSQPTKVEVSYQVANIGKIETELMWTPRYCWQESVDYIIDKYVLKGFPDSA
ncbi:NAD-dependent epimerase/dehydratase family protein [Candidatus Margulisiibacteriota bacterium]